MRTKKAIKISRTEVATIRTIPGSQVRIDKDNSLTFSFSLVLDETLQLIETPTIKPSIQSFTHKFISALTYSFQVLQYNYISRSNDLFADFVVDCTHVAFLFTRDSFKFSSGRFCAFTLQSSPQILMLDNSGLMTFENLAVGSDSKIIYSDINTNCFLVATRSRIGVDISIECNVKEQYTFFIFDNFKCLIAPIKVLPVILRNIYSNIFTSSWSESSNPDFIKTECEKIPIKANWTEFNNRLFLSLVDLRFSDAFAMASHAKLAGSH